MAVSVLPKILMELQIVVMPGSNRVDMPLLQAAAQDFGWAIQIARDIRELLAIQARGKVGAMLFQQDSVLTAASWLETIALLKSVAPDIRLVACNKFSEEADYPKLCRAGLFHALWMPLREHEVRQCLGFVWEAEKRLAVTHRKMDSEMRQPTILARAAS